MTARELRRKYIDFFITKNHAEISGKSLIPENDPTVLFTTAGMHPLVPYILGEEHPAGTRLVNVQKCIRTGDIDEVGDSSHLTFFEMLGNWSLGDYFKKESISMSWEFLTSAQWLGIDPERLAVTVFAGDDDAPRDVESANFWVDAGIPEDRIFYLPKKDNWWGPPGQTGPCGPDTEIFIDTGIPGSAGSRPGGQTENGLKSGIMFLCSITKRRKVAFSLLNEPAWIPAWVSNEPSPFSRVSSPYMKPSFFSPSSTKFKN